MEMSRTPHYIFMNLYNFAEFLGSLTRLAGVSAVRMLKLEADDSRDAVVQGSRGLHHVVGGLRTLISTPFAQGKL